MAATIVLKEPQLPWAEGTEDRLFKFMVIILVILFLISGIIINQIVLPEIERKQLADVAPRLAKLIVEKKKTPPPPPPKPEPEKEEPKKPEPKKEQKKPEPKKEKPKPVDRREAARAKAQKSGLLAMQDDLADLRDSFDFDSIGDQPQQKAATQATTVAPNSDILTAKASQGSGGITTSSPKRQAGTSELAQKKTAAVKSNIASSKKVAEQAKGSKSGRNASRTQEEIERVFQKNKGAIDTMYNRELRKDPTLQGKVVVELTIAPNGTVTKCVIVSSELGNQKLEKRLVSKIKKFRFTAKQVPVITVSYPIDFLPS